jgi:hypothetical protein
VEPPLCLNGGACTASRGGAEGAAKAFSCGCAAGWGGPRCEAVHDVVPCDESNILELACRCTPGGEGEGLAALPPSEGYAKSPVHICLAGDATDAMPGADANQLQLRGGEFTIDCAAAGLCQVGPALHAY